MKRIFMKFMTVVAFAVAPPATAYDAAAEVKITQIELTYMPDRIVFQADRAVGSCPAASMLVWEPRNATQAGKDQNAQAVLAAMMTAKATGAFMRLFVINNGCRVEYIYLL